MSQRLKVGVIGCGVIAQVMHLPHLLELDELFELAAMCDISEPTARACAERYGNPKTFTRWEEMLSEPLDAVLVLTSGSHAPAGIAAARAGLQVMVEKPMGLNRE